ncbi:MAG: Uncharacterised protein [Halieaceae bacterium]|nr:MAG: Uncharacterised protein [Halieaceae bacterium]
MCVQPQAKGILGHTGHKYRRLPRGQPLLGLTRELRIQELDAEHIAALIPDIVASDFYPARQQVAEFTKLFQRVDESGAQPINVGAARRSGNQIDVALCDRRTAFRHPFQCVFDGFAVARSLMHDGDSGYAVCIPHRGFEVLAQSVFEYPAFVFLRFGFDRQTHAQSRAKNRLGSQQVTQASHGQRRRIEVAAFGQKTDAGAGIAFTHRVNAGELGYRLATLVALAVEGAVTLYFHL